MRIPFSVYLMPLFWLSVAILPKDAYSWPRFFATFFILHILLYPASNGYNSLTDKDEGPVGGLENPPAPNRELQILVTVFDLLALVGAFLLDVVFGYFVSIYWLASKAYSSPSIRLKKYPWISWLTVTIFQGGWTVIMVWAGLSNLAELDWARVGLFPLAASILIAGSYPITQVYQHQEDKRRGDITLSLLLGTKGTFIFSLIFQLLGSGMLIYLLYKVVDPLAIFVLLVCSAPGILFFRAWMNKVFQSPNLADYMHTMTYNKRTSIGISLAFLIVWLLKIGSDVIPLQP